MPLAQIRNCSRKTGSGFTESYNGRRSRPTLLRLLNCRSILWRLLPGPRVNGGHTRCNASHSFRAVSLEHNNSFTPFSGLSTDSKRDAMFRRAWRNDTICIGLYAATRATAHSLTVSRAYGLHVSRATSPICPLVEDLSGPFQ